MSRNQTSWRLQIIKLILIKYQVDQELNNIFLLTICPHEKKIDWMRQTKKRLKNASFFPLRYKRLASTKQPSWNFLNNLFQPTYSLEQKLDGRHHTTWRLRTNKIINSHLGILQTTYSNPYFFLSIKLIGNFKAKRRPRIAKIIPLRYQR